MAVAVHIPSPPLNAYIHCLWYADRPIPYPRLKILPMPSLHLMINFGSAFHIYEADHTEPLAACTESWSVGLWDGYHIMDAPHEMQILNVSFKPGGAYPFLQLSLSELRNQFVPLDAIWGCLAAEIRERLYAAPTVPARFALFEQLLLARLAEVPYGFKAVQFGVAEIARAHGTLSIRALSDHIGMSQKHLIAQFKQMVGGTPKALARLYRFKNVIHSLDPLQPVDWTRVAHQACYYDQPHFNKDFEAFTGHSPTDYLRLRRQYYAAYPERASYPQQLPTG